MTRVFNEDQIVIRFPVDIARQINDQAKIQVILDSNEQEDQFRLFKVSIDQNEFQAVLLDLPCILESHKSLDYINYFKSADICQMLYVIPPHEMPDYRAKRNFQLDKSLYRMLERNSKYSLKSGITPGTRNITQRFFQKERDENPEEVRKVETLIKTVMEQGSTIQIEEELFELSENDEMPQDYSQIWFPPTNNEDSSLKITLNNFT